MKKKLLACIIFISQLFLAQLALAYTITPSTFADNFNRINQRLALRDPLIISPKRNHV